MRRGQRRPTRPEVLGTAGFTLLEIIIVVALIAFVYTIAMPRLGMKNNAEVSTKLGKLAADVRSAYDMAVLNRKPYRLVFSLESGDYWLEECNRDHVLLGDQKLARDPTADDEKEAREAFDEQFALYKQLAGDEAKLQNGDVVAATSPVLEAKDQLEPPKWSPVGGQEWGKRSLGPLLIIKDMQAEHLAEKDNAEDLGDKARGIIYFMPSGYVEKAVIHIYYRKGDSGIDEDQTPYTLVTDPLAGTASVSSGYEEVDVHADKDQQG